MAKANPTLQQPYFSENSEDPLLPSAVLAILALRQARQEVKRELKARGEKVALTPRHLTLLAEQYLADHRAELIAQAHAWVMANPELRALYEREQRKYAKARERNSTNSHKA